MSKTYNQNPLVSIVICTYNGLPYLQEQLESIVNQDYKNIEIIVVDDGSTDATWQVLLDWNTNYPNLFSFYKNQTNLGYNKNFETAIKKANGEFISICDQDDVWMLNKTSKLVKALINNPEAMMSYCKNVSWEGSQILKYNYANLRNYFHGKETKKLFFQGIEGHTMLLRKQLIEKTLPFPNDVIYDLWLTVNACAFGGIVFVDEFLVKHRIHDLNVTRRLKSTNGIENKYSRLRALKQFQKIPALSTSDSKYLENLITYVEIKEMQYKNAFYLDFFLFILKNKSTIFFYKKRKFQLISQIKHAYKYAKNGVN